MRSQVIYVLQMTDISRVKTTVHLGYEDDKYNRNVFEVITTKFSIGL